MEIIERIDHWGRTAPDHPAYKSGGRTLSYGELCRRSGALAAYLAEQIWKYQPPHPEKTP